MSRRNRERRRQRIERDAQLEALRAFNDEIRAHFSDLVASLPEAEQTAITNATAEKIKALAKTKTLDELIDMGVNHAIEKAADEAPQPPITQDRIDHIIELSKEG